MLTAFSGKIELDDSNFISALRYHNMMPREDLRIKISEHVQDKITVKNAAAVYRSVHNIPRIAEKILDYIGMLCTDR